MNKRDDIMRIEPFLRDRAIPFPGGFNDLDPELTLEESVALLRRMVASALPPPDERVVGHPRWACRAG